MLVLSRKTNETIHIGPDIQVRVLAIKGSRVRLAIDAPDSIRITRSEIEFDLDSEVGDQPVFRNIPVGRERSHSLQALSMRGVCDENRITTVPK
jgi:carbon storage regulator